MQAKEHLEKLYAGCRQLSMRADDHDQCRSSYYVVHSTLEAFEGLSEKVKALESELALLKPKGEENAVS